MYFMISTETIQKRQFLSFLNYTEIKSIADDLLAQYLSEGDETIVELRTKSICSLVKRLYKKRQSNI